MISGVRVKCQGKTPVIVSGKESFTLALDSDPGVFETRGCIEPDYRLLLRDARAGNS